MDNKSDQTAGFDINTLSPEMQKLYAELKGGVSKPTS